MPDEIDDHIRKVVDAAPPLTQEQIDRLAVLLSYHCETQITGDELRRGS